MKIYTYCPFNDIPSYVMTSKTDGIAIVFDLANLAAMGGSFNYAFMPDLKNTIKAIAKQPGITENKKVSIAVRCGNSCGNYVESNFQCVTFFRKPQNNKDPLKPGLPVVVPVPFATKEVDGVTTYPYLDYLEHILAILSSQLRVDQVVWNAITHVFVTGINEVTRETRFTSMDWKTATDQHEALDDAAYEWKGVAYTYDKAKFSIRRCLEIFAQEFPEKELIWPSIPGLNSIPCINKNGDYCNPKQRPNIIQEILIAGGNFVKPNTCYTAFNSATVLPYQDKAAQISNEIYGNPANNDSTEYELCKQHAVDLGVEYFEIHPPIVRSYPHLFK